ncbi:MAG: DsrE family protein [Ferruginibacter sp.]
MKQLIFLLLIFFTNIFILYAQPSVADSIRNGKRDSTLRAIIHLDSMKVNAEYAEKEKWDKFEHRAVYPLLKGGKGSGVLPVNNPTEIPDPNMDYKLLFEVVINNPDSLAKEVNFGLDEVSRVINLHIASGIPLKRILPVLIVHAEAVNALRNNESFKKKYKIDNPNLKLISDLKKMGAKFIVCGQAMEFFETYKEDLLPDIKISLTAQTVLSGYQLKGYVKY